MSQDGNRLERSMPKDVLDAAKLGIKSLFTQVEPYTVHVTEEEIPSLLKMSDGDKTLVGDCKSEGKDADEFMPAYHKVADLNESDLLHDQLYELEDAAFDLYMHIRRNRMLAASQSLSWVSTFYALIKIAATGKNKMAAAIAMFKRLEGYYLKRTEASKAKKRRDDADKKRVEEERAAEKAALAAEKEALAAEKAAFAAKK